MGGCRVRHRWLKPHTFPLAMPTGKRMAENELDIEQPWSQLPKENNLWYSRFLIFRDMGPVRSILGAQRIECHRVNKEPPRWTARSWREKSVEFEWHKRAEAWDRHQREEVFTEGYAYDLVRIKKLNGLLDKLERRINEALDTMRPSKGGFPDFMVNRWLEAMKAIAEETGGRVQRKEVSGPNGAPLEVLLFLPEQERDDVLEDVAEDEEQWQ